MDQELIGLIIDLRRMVGFLGEKDQFEWWQSTFFIQGSSSFLAPLFGRTEKMAQFKGVTQAAALIHDQSIGVGKVYHLFRMPEFIEQSIHQHFMNGKDESEDVGSKGKDEVMQMLNKTSIQPEKVEEGPVHIGTEVNVRQVSFWKEVAGYYHNAFQQGFTSFPYFSDLE